MENVKKATLRGYYWAAFAWCALFPIIAEAQVAAVPKEFKGAVDVGKALLLTCQVFAGLYLSKGALDVGMAYKHANPQARQMRDDLGLAALYVFAGGGIMEWIKRSITVTTT